MNKRNNPTVSKTELHWLINSLLTDINQTQLEIDQAESGSLIRSIGRIRIDGRKNLITKLNDILESGARRIDIT